MRGPDRFDIVAAGVAIGVTLFSITLSTVISKAEPTASYRLVGELAGQAYIMDVGLTPSDCRRATTEARAAWGSNVRIYCEREG